MNSQIKSVTFNALAVSLIFVGWTPLVIAQVSLGTASSFGVLAGSAVTNTGSSVVLGDVGVSPGSAVTGFPPGTVSGGGIHSADAAAAQAQSDVTVAYNAIAGTACTLDLTGTDLGGLTLTPGVYCFASSAQLTGPLILNAQGNPNALFIFKVGTTLTTASNSSVQVINGGSGCNVFWQLGSSATLGTGSSFVGNILALTSITLTTGATIAGRMLARNGAVTTDTNSVTACVPGTACAAITVNPSASPNGTVGGMYSLAISAAGGTVPYTFMVAGGSLPAGLTLNATTGVISGTPTTAGSSTFVVSAVDANNCSGSRSYSVMITVVPVCPSITINPATLPSGSIGAMYSQTIAPANGIAPYTFSVSSGTLPPGLILNSVTGVVSGAPTTAALFAFTITAADANTCAGGQSYSVQIVGGPPPPAVNNIPTLSGLGAIVLMLLIVAIGSWASMRET